MKEYLPKKGIKHLALATALTLSPFKDSHLKTNQPLVAHCEADADTRYPNRLDVFQTDNPDTLRFQGEVSLNPLGTFFIPKLEAEIRRDETGIDPSIDGTQGAVQRIPNSRNRISHSATTTYNSLGLLTEGDSGRFHITVYLPEPTNLISQKQPFDQSCKVTITRPLSTTAGGTLLRFGK